MKNYYKWINQKSLLFKNKLYNRIKRFQNIRGLIEIYLGLSKWKFGNAKDILNFIQPYNL